MARLQWLLATSIVALTAVDVNAAPPDLTWTPELIVEAPIITGTAISDDGLYAGYISRQDHLSGNFRDSTFVEVDLQTYRARTVLTAKWISGLMAVPGTHDWSVMADVGQGVQLYRLSAKGGLTALAVTQDLVQVGADPSRSVYPSLSEPDQLYGILDYQWAPDGSAFWYSTAKAQSLPREAAIKTIVTPTVAKPEYQPAQSTLHLVTKTGEHVIVAQAKPYSHWPTAFYTMGAGRWHYDARTKRYGLLYDVPEDAVAGNQTASHWLFDPETQSRRPVAHSNELDVMASGARTLNTVGAWSDRHLVERLPDGHARDLGKIGFSAHDWTSGSWETAGGDVILAVRYDRANVRDGLIKVSTDGQIQDMEPNVSLDHCAFTPAVDTGICIREGIATPPQLVIINPDEWNQKVLLEVDARYQAIVPLQYYPVTWHENDMSAAGFVVLPRGYHKGKRYPAVFITHGYDADNTFVNPAFQWSYPAQVFSERGYVVIYVNDIPMGQSRSRTDSYRQWTSGEGGMSGAEVQKRVWLDQLKIYGAAIDELAKSGVIDRHRVGIMGYSRGSQMACVAVTQTDWFRAASSGDGSYFSPSSYWMGDNYKIYGMLFGGAPYDKRWVPHWRSLAPAFRAKQVKAAMLFQMATVGPGMMDFYNALKDAGVPALYVSLPEETHIPNRPLNRLAIMRQNIDWFDQWLSPGASSHDKQTAH